MDGAAYEPATAGEIFFRPPDADDLDAIYRLEVASYPPDEAATLEKLRMRIEQAPGQFLVALQLPQQTEAGDGTIVGYACGTLSNDDCLTHESMSTHDPSGTLLCIHSVVIAQPLRRRGLGSRLLGAYVRYASAMAPHAVEIRLLCKQQLVTLYERAGFSLVGPSHVQHGAEQWLEMVQTLRDDGSGNAGGDGSPC